MNEEEYQEHIKKFDQGYFEEGKHGGYGAGWSKQYDKDHITWKALAKWVYAQFNPDSILEIGCSFGWLTKALQKYCFVRGIDISQYAIGVGQMYGCPIYRADARKIPFENDSFNFICGFDILEHLPEEFIDEAISEINRVCQKFAFFNIPSYPGTDSTHLNIKPPEYWIEKFSKYFQVHNEESRYWLVKKGIKFPNMEFTKYWPQQPYTFEDGRRVRIILRNPDGTIIE